MNLVLILVDLDKKFTIVGRLKIIEFRLMVIITKKKADIIPNEFQND